MAIIRQIADLDGGRREVPAIAVIFARGVDRGLLERRIRNYLPSSFGVEFYDESEVGEIDDQVERLGVHINNLRAEAVLSLRRVIGTRDINTFREDQERLDLVAKSIASAIRQKLGRGAREVPIGVPGAVRTIRNKCTVLALRIEENPSRAKTVLDRLSQSFVHLAGLLPPGTHPLAQIDWYRYQLTDGVINGHEDADKVTSSLLEIVLESGRELLPVD